MKDEIGPVLDDPFDDFTAVELHGLSHRGGEVDVPLLTGFSFNKLDFGGVSHGVFPPLISS